MAWVVEITGFDIAGAADVTRLFSLGKAIAFTDHAPSTSGLISWQSPTQRIAISQTGVSKSEADRGEIQIANAAKDITLAAPLDDLVDWAWQGRVASLYWVPARVWADRVLCGRGALEQPVADAVSLRFPLRDPRAGLSAPLQTAKYGGTNVAPDGVDGTGDLKGRPRPVCYGIVSNRPGVCVNTIKLIWELCDSLATVLCVRDGGIPLSAGTSRANVASMLANAPPPGGYDYCATSTGTYVRFGSTPVFQPTFDFTTGSTEADRTHAQVWQAIRVDRCATDPGDIDSASITAMDTAAPNEVGFWWPDEITQQSALDQVLASLSGYEVQALDGSWSIGRLEEPSGAPDIALLMVTPSTAMKAADRRLISAPERARPAYAQDGAPPYRVNVRWGLNGTVMKPADFAGAAAARLKDKFASAWRTETATDTAIWNPADNSGAFPNAPELTVDTGYQPGVDTLTCPHAADEADRLLALYGSLPIKGQYQVSFEPEPGDTFLPGAVAQLTYPRFGLSSGPLFVVLQSALLVNSRTAKASMILGLQT